jgi:hypothetical protein
MSVTVSVNTAIVKFTVRGGWHVSPVVATTQLGNYEGGDFSGLWSRDYGEGLNHTEVDGLALEDDGGVIEFAGGDEILGEDDSLEIVGVLRVEGPIPMLGYVSEV